MAIVLLTDFGTRDPYVAAMKGVIASRTADLIHDLSHDIAPFDVWGAAFFLRDAEAFWPAGTVFVCVVDPGVGTARRILAVRASGRLFLAPDNGLLAFIEGEARSVIRDDLFRPTEATTFHGRDRFAPVAAALANGLDFESLGPPIDDPVPLAYDPPRYRSDAIEGTIIGVDRFGNLLTDVELARVGFPRFVLQAGGHLISRLEYNYGGAAPGLFLIVGSAGRIEISMKNASASEFLRSGASARPPESAAVASAGGDVPPGLSRGARIMILPG